MIPVTAGLISPVYAHIGGNERRRNEFDQFCPVGEEGGDKMKYDKRTTR